MSYPSKTLCPMNNEMQYGLSTLLPSSGLSREGRRRSSGLRSDFRGLLLGITHLILKEEGPQVRLGLVIDSRGRWLKSEGKEMVEGPSSQGRLGKGVRSENRGAFTQAERRKAL